MDNFRLPDNFFDPPDEWDDGPDAQAFKPVPVKTQRRYYMDCNCGARLLVLKHLDRVRCPHCNKIHTKVSIKRSYVQSYTTLSNAVDAIPFNPPTKMPNHYPVERIKEIILNEVTEMVPTQEARFIISSLKPMPDKSNFKFAPMRFYKTVEDATKACQQYLTLDNPMYVLKVVTKIELAPPPTVTTDFDG